MVLWEYKVLNGDAHRNDIFSTMCQLGREGWELVGPVGYHIYLKRPIQEAEDDNQGEQQARKAWRA